MTVSDRPGTRAVVPGPVSASEPLESRSFGPDGRFGNGRVESLELGPLTLEEGEVLPLHVAFRHDGPGPGQAPQVLVVHALTGSADAAGDWWAPLIGSGRALDTDRFGVLCANLLGGRYGSLGPTSRDPRTGHPYGSAFPAVSTRDQARAQWALLDAIGIGEVALVVGGSLGGMVALETALDRPTSVRAVMPIASPAALGALAIAWNHVQLELLERLGEEGLDLARRIALTTYRSEADFDHRFGRGLEEDGRFSVASYLVYQGQKLVDRFDPDTYRVLVESMDRHDIGRDRGGVLQALGRLAPNGGQGHSRGTRLVGLGIEGDILYGPAQVKALVAAAVEAGVDATYAEIQSNKGHDAFLIEWNQLDGVLRGALATAT